MTIYPIKNIFNKKIFLVGLVIVVILFLVILNIFFSRQQVQKKTVQTIPLIPQNTPPLKQNLPSNYSQIFQQEKRIAISESDRVIAINNNGELVQVSVGNTIVISPSESKVINYVLSGETIFYETGLKDGLKNSFYLYSFNDHQNKLVNLDSAKPIISYSINPAQTELVLLGEYNSKTFKSNLYRLNLQTGTKDIVGFSVQANEISWIDNSTLLLGKSSDKDEPNYYVSIFSLFNNKYLAKDISMVKKSISFDKENNNLFFIDSTDQLLSSFSISDGSITPYIKLSLLDYETFIIPKNKQIGLINKISTGLSLVLIDLINKKIINTSTYSINSYEQYIEKYYVNGRYFIKTYNSQTKQYTLKAISFY